MVLRIVLSLAVVICVGWGEEGGQRQRAVEQRAAALLRLCLVDGVEAEAVVRKIQGSDPLAALVPLAFLKRVLGLTDKGLADIASEAELVLGWLEFDEAVAEILVREIADGRRWHGFQRNTLVGLVVAAGRGEAASRRKVLRFVKSWKADGDADAVIAAAHALTSMREPSGKIGAAEFTAWLHSFSAELLDSKDVKVQRACARVWQAFPSYMMQFPETLQGWLEGQSVILARDAWRCLEKQPQVIDASILRVLRSTLLSSEDLVLDAQLRVLIRVDRSKLPEVSESLWSAYERCFDREQKAPIAALYLSVVSRMEYSMARRWLPRMVELHQGHAWRHYLYMKYDHLALATGAALVGLLQEADGQTALDRISKGIGPVKRTLNRRDVASSLPVELLVLVIRIGSAGAVDDSHMADLEGIVAKIPKARLQGFERGEVNRLALAIHVLLAERIDQAMRGGS